MKKAFFSIQYILVLLSGERKTAFQTILIRFKQFFPVDMIAPASSVKHDRLKMQTAFQ